jgi:hypothetical protein
MMASTISSHVQTSEARAGIRVTKFPPFEAQSGEPKRRLAVSHAG